MQIRDMKQHDRDIYFAMAKDFYSGDATLFPLSEEKLEATFQQVIEGSPYTRGLILEDEGNIVGYSLLSFTWSCEAGGMVILLEELYLLADQRGKQYGSQFFEWVESEYRDTSKRFRLEVCPHNQRAKKLYEKLGYQVLEYIQMIKQ